MFLSIHGYVDPVPDLGQADTGGQVVYIIEVAKKLARMSIKVDIYTRWFEGRRRIEKITDGARIIRIPCGPKHFIRKEELFPFLDEFATNLVSFIKEKGIRYDIMHSHYWDAGYVALKLKSRLNEVKHVHTSHSLGAAKKERLGTIASEKIYHFNTRIYWEKKIIENADAIIATSPFEQDIIKKYYNVDRVVKIIPPGVDTVFFSPMNTREQVDLPNRYVFSTGRLDYTKGFDLLIKAFYHVAKEVQDVKLILGGGSHKPTDLEIKIRGELDQLINKLGLKSKVIQTGRIPNELLPTYYAKANVVAVPSRYDLFGMVALEALACETPVVVSKYAGVSRYITENIGLISNPEDEHDFAEKIIYILRNKEIASRMGKNGRKFILSNFTWENIANRIRETYEEL